MDLITIGIAIGVCAVIAIIIYVMTAMGMRELTYEEALAEHQRKVQQTIGTTETKPTKTNNEKQSKDKKFKKWGKKAKEKDGSHSASTSYTPVDGALHELHDEGTDYELGSDVEAKPELLEKKKVNKPTLNKETVKTKDAKKHNEQPKKDKSVPKEQKVEKIPEKVEEGKPAKVDPTPTPADEIEKPVKAEAKSTGRRRSRVDSEGSGVSMNQKEANSPVPVQANKKAEKKRDAPAKVDSSSEPTSTTATKDVGVEADLVKPKKLKSISTNTTANQVTAVVTQAEPIVGKVTVSKMESLIEKTQFNEVEIQRLIDVLLNRQQMTTEWTKKGSREKLDSVAALRKLLQDREQSLKEEQQRVVSMSEKVRDVKSEMQRDRAKWVQTERALREKLTMNERDMEAVNMKLRRGQEQHDADTNAVHSKLQQLQMQLTEQHRLNLQSKDENQILQQALAQRDSEQSVSVASDLARLQHELEQAIMAAQQNEAVNASLQRQCDEVQRKNTQFEEHVCQLEIAKRDEENALKQRLNDVTNKLNTAESEKADLHAKLHQREEASRAWEAEKESFAKQVSDIEDSVVNHKNTTNNLENQIQDLIEERAHLNNQVSAFRSECHELSSKLAQAESEVQKLHLEKDEISNKLATELAQKTNGHHEDENKQVVDLHEHQEQLRIKDEAAEQLLRELTEKNAAIERLNEDLQCKSNEIELQRKKNDASINEVKSDQENAAKALLQRILPEVNVADGNMPFDDWSREYEHQTQLYLQRKAEEVQRASGESAALEAQKQELVKNLESYNAEKEKLGTEVEHYKTVLADTEVMLKKLQCSVEEEEVKWKERFCEKQSELDRVVEEKSQAENDKQMLQESLEQVRAAEEAAVEMQQKLRELQDRLQSEESERRTLETHHEEAQRRTKELEDALSAANTDLEELRHSKLNNANSNEEHENNQDGSHFKVSKANGPQINEITEQHHVDP